MNLIKVDITHSRISTEPFFQNKLLGGRATIDYWMTEYVSPTVHPLSGGESIDCCRGSPRRDECRQAPRLDENRALTACKCNI